MTRRDVVPVAAGLAAIVAYGGAIAVLKHGYPHALDTACPNGAPAPVAFWVLLAAAVGLAVAGFAFRPRRRSGADTFALCVVIGMPVAALAAWFGYAVAYACWE